MSQPEIHKFLNQMSKLSSSDLHLKVGAPPIFRVNGEIKRANTPPLSAEDIKKLIYEVITPFQQKRLEEQGDLDLALELESAERYRVNIFRQRGVYSLVARHIKSKIPALKELLIPESVNRVTNLNEGLVLVTGVTGSGKSTTINSILHNINNARACHIITIEDPIEFVHTDNKAIINQREIGQDTANFLNSLKYALRQDPDVIFVGELRDIDTVETALMAAETGHLVLATIHSATVAQTFSRILDFFPAERHDQIRTLLQYNLKTVISQRLLRGCTKEFPRVPAVEIMFSNGPVKKAIEEKRDAHLENIMYDDKEDGMQTFNQSLLDLFKRKLITEEEAVSRSPNPEALKMNLRGIFVKAN